MGDYGRELRILNRVMHLLGWTLQSGELQYRAMDFRSCQAWMTQFGGLQPRATNFGSCHTFTRLEATHCGAAISSHDFFIVSCVYLSVGCNLEGNCLKLRILDLSIPCLHVSGGWLQSRATDVGWILSCHGFTCL